MDKARNSIWYQDEPMDISPPRNSRKTGLDQDWNEMKSELHKISINIVKETKQRGRPVYKAPVAQNKKTTELQREKDKNELLLKELERVSGGYKELYEKYQSDVANIRQQAYTSQTHFTNAAFTPSQQTFSAELQAEKDKCKALQEQLEKTNATLNEVCTKYQTDIVIVGQQKDYYFQLSLENEIKVRKLLQTDYDQLDAAYTLSQQKFSAELREEKDKYKALQEQLERTSVSLQEVNMRYQTDINYVTQQAYMLQLHLDNEVKLKEALQTDYDNLQAAHTQNKQKFSAECETEKITILQQELDTLRASHCQIRQLYDTDVVTVKQQAETLQHELERETKAHADTVSEGWRVINAMRADQDAQVNNIQQNAFKRERTFESELVEIKAQLKEQISVNLKLSEAEKEDYGPPRKRRREVEKCEPMKQQATINPEPSLGFTNDVEMSEENLPETTRKPSLWKSAHRFLGLK